MCVFCLCFTKRFEEKDKQKSNRMRAKPSIICRIKEEAQLSRHQENKGTEQKCTELKDHHHQKVALPFFCRCALFVLLPNSITILGFYGIQMTKVIYGNGVLVLFFLETKKMKTILFQFIIVICVQDNLFQFGKKSIFRRILFCGWF